MITIFRSASSAMPINPIIFVLMFQVPGVSWGPGFVLTKTLAYLV